LQIIGLRPPSLAFFRWDIQKYKGGSPYILPNFCTSSLDVHQNLVTHNLKNMKFFWKRDIISLSLFKYPAAIRKKLFDNPNLVRQFENSINPLRNPPTPPLPKKKRKEKVSILINSEPEGFLLKRFHLET